MSERKHRLLRVILLSFVTLGLMAGAVLAQEPASSNAPEPQAVSGNMESELLREMMDLVGRDGDMTDTNLAHALDAVLKNQDFQSLMKAVLESDDLSGSLQAQDVASRPGRLLLGLLPFSLAGIVILFFAVGILLARLVFAINVYVDARAGLARGRSMVFMGPFLWALGVVIGGMLVVMVYWLVHRQESGKVPVLPSA